MGYSGIALVALAAAQAAAPALTSDSATAKVTPVDVSPTPMPAPAVEPARVIAPAVQPVAAATSGLLWRNIENGMSVAKLRALYPRGSLYPTRTTEPS